MDKNEAKRPIDPDNNSEQMDNNESNFAEGMLGDEQRVRILSPGMMVLKRFLRNRLAITGLIILVVMFLFSFLGGVLMPYRQDTTFFTTETLLKEYAGATVNEELRYTLAEGAAFGRGAQARLVLAINKEETTFSSDGYNYTLERLSPDHQSYLVREMRPLVDISTRKNLFVYEPAKGFSVDDTFKKAFEAAFLAGENSFQIGDEEYTITRSNNRAEVGQSSLSALASMLVMNPASPEDSKLVNSFAFRLEAERAITGKQSQFEVDSTTYLLNEEDGNYLIEQQQAEGNKPIAVVSDIIINAIMPDVFLSLEFKAEAASAIHDKRKEFDHDGVHYRIDLVHRTYNIKTDTVSHVFDMYHYPDGKHWLGTDQNGMDLLTRLMYGGRISLMVGFVVIFIEMLIGITIGGISGYFGGWVDTLLMRFIDLFNCIPYWPILIITGSVMDTMEVDPYVRVFLLMLILGLMGWTGIARVVRGQILALREQDFMVATEATGVRVSRRISRHLVPNVMPLLIVQATLGLGGIILTEATLSFLGLGVKYPIASWGSIIHAASNPYIVTNYWFIWVPAGMLILLTVLGFNFVGDGLRDAFDPKMKR